MYTNLSVGIDRPSFSSNNADRLMAAFVTMLKGSGNLLSCFATPHAIFMLLQSISAFTLVWVTQRLHSHPPHFFKFSTESTKEEGQYDGLGIAVFIPDHLSLEIAVLVSGQHRKQRVTMQVVSYT